MLLLSMFVLVGLLTACSSDSSGDADKENNTGNENNASNSDDSEESDDGDTEEDKEIHIYTDRKSVV